MNPVLEVVEVSVDFPVPRPGLLGRAGILRAVREVSFNIAPGETLGIVGESGCGKSTLARALKGLVRPASGEVRFMGKGLTGISRGMLRRRSREMQMVFQDPLASLDPRMKVGEIVAEPLRAHYPDMLTRDRMGRVRRVLRQVGLAESDVGRYPHEFSGGQCQRIGIARALVLEPRLLICDEPVSALDVSIRAQIVNLLLELREELGLSLVLIAHDLGVVRHICDRVLVMYLGRLVELAPAAALFATPRHPYTQGLISAIPVADPRLERRRSRTMLAGEVPSPLNPPAGCAFRSRCPHAGDECAGSVPRLRLCGESEAACHRLEAIHGPVPV